MDIGDLDLNRVKFSGEKRIVFVAKHLCGDATDLALRSISLLQNKSRVRGVLIATCCHHRCSWAQAVGREFLRETFDLDADSFFILSRLSTWATCGFKQHSSHDDKANENTSLASQDAPKFSEAERKAVGYMCKTVIDWSRVQFLKEHLGMTEAGSSLYTKTDFTLENIHIHGTLHEDTDI